MWVERPQGQPRIDRYLDLGLSFRDSTARKTPKPRLTYAWDKGLPSSGVHLGPPIGVGGTRSGCGGPSSTRSERFQSQRPEPEENGFQRVEGRPVVASRSGAVQQVLEISSRSRSLTSRSRRSTHTWSQSDRVIRGRLDDGHRRLRVCPPPESVLAHSIVARIVAPRRGGGVASGADHQIRSPSAPHGGGVPDAADLASTALATSRGALCGRDVCESTHAG